MTWSKDQSLRIWKIEPGLQEIVGQDFDEDDEDDYEEDEEDEASRGGGGGVVEGNMMKNGRMEEQS